MKMNWLNYIYIVGSWYCITYTATKYSHIIYNILPTSIQSRFIHQRKLFPCTFAAHRGGAGERPENTLSSFEHAYKLGCQLLELDVHLTADKQVVVHHDTTTGRVCEKDIDIRTVNYADLPHIRRTGLKLIPPFHNGNKTLDYIHSNHHDNEALSDHIVDTVSDMSRTKQQQYNGNNIRNNNEVSIHDTYRIPLLSEVFTRYSNAAINIDLKDNDNELMYETYKVIKQHNRQSTVAWGSSRDNTCQDCYKLDPSIPLFFSGKQVLLLHIKYMLGILPFCHIKERMLDIPYITKEFEQNATELITSRIGNNNLRYYALRLFIKFYQYISYNPLLYKHLQLRGINTCVWVLQNDNEFEQAFNAGITGIMTDYPTKLHNYLKRTNRI